MQVYRDRSDTMPIKIFLCNELLVRDPVEQTLLLRHLFGNEIGIEPIVLPGR